MHNPMAAPELSYTYTILRPLLWGGHLPNSVLVLGAGASLANALHFRSKRAIGSNPPLDESFFDAIHSLRVPIPAQLRAYGALYPGADPFSTGQFRRMGMESFFRDLFYDFEDAQRGSLQSRAYVQLVDVYVRVLRETTNWMGVDSRTGGPVGRLIAATASNFSEVSILTFNHDLVIENEIQKRARLNRRWCLERGYGNIGTRMTVTRPTVVGPMFRAHDANCRHEEPIQVLKLHGSLNWYVRLRGKSPTPRQLSGLGNAQQLFCSPRRSVAEQPLYIHNRPGPGRKAWRTWPVVVPPVQMKSPLIRSYVAEVWNDAKTAIEGSHRLVFFGYSLPSLDLAAEKMFQRSLSRANGLNWIDVVNPDPASAQRFAGLLGTRPTRWYPSVDAFLKAGGVTHVP